MSLQSAQSFVFGSWDKKPVEVEQIDDNLSSDGGLIAFYQLDQKLGWTEAFASLISDPRSDPTHSARSIVRQRLFGIIAGYEDQNDHDSLRSDSVFSLVFKLVFKLIADQSPDGDDLASQPTISRLENAVTASDLLAMEDWFIDRFVESFDEEPAENDMIVFPSLLFGSAHASLAAADDLRRVIEKIRQRFPHVTIHVRADSGFAVPEMYDTLERLDGVIYSIGYQMNARIKRESEELLQQSVAAFESTGEAQRNFLLLDYRARTWPRSRHVIIKCEVQSAGTNRRAVVTNRPGDPRDSR